MDNLERLRKKIKSEINITRNIFVFILMILILLPFVNFIQNISFSCEYEIISVLMDIGIMLSLILMIFGIFKVCNEKKENIKNASEEELKEESHKEIINPIFLIIIVVVFFIIVFLYSNLDLIFSSTIAKPIIYLYPTEETEITVSVGYPNQLTCSYPKYTTGWNVLAKSNGDLIDLDTGRSLYSLYYESSSVVKFKVEEDGFIVKGDEVAEFLEEKLAILGLTEREAEEFIVYWLPILQENKYNYIRFATEEEINENMPLEFSVEPDTLIRVLMTYKGLNKPIEVKEQKLETPERIGFVAVEWGGTEIK
jgi:hypothetical protein